jgi:hypothetical protein
MDVNLMGSRTKKVGYYRSARYHIRIRIKRAVYSVVKNPVVVSLGSIELDSEAPDITNRLSTAFFVAYG